MSKRRYSAVEFNLVNFTDNISELFYIFRDAF